MTLTVPYRAVVGSLDCGQRKEGWTDAIRHLHPNEAIYTLWNYFRNAFARNAGMRIDHFLLNPRAATLLLASGADREVHSWEKTSDRAQRGLPWRITRCDD